MVQKRDAVRVRLAEEETNASASRRYGLLPSPFASAHARGRCLGRRVLRIGFGLGDACDFAFHFTSPRAGFAAADRHRVRQPSVVRKTLPRAARWDWIRIAGLPPGARYTARRSDPSIPRAAAGDESLLRRTPRTTTPRSALAQSCESEIGR